MSKIPTAEEFLIKESILLKTIEESGNFPLNLTRDTHIGTAKDIKKAMIEFAKLHVEVALKQASINANLYLHNTGWKHSSDIKTVKCHNYDASINKDSILNAYALENIK